jgi:hypothetical protein
VFFCLGTITAHSQALQHLLLKIPDRVDQLFQQLKNDSNFINYIKLQREARDYGNSYTDSLRRSGQTESAPYKDSTGQHATFMANAQQKMNDIVQLKQTLYKQYPLFNQLTYAEQKKLTQLGTDYHFKQTPQ